MVALGFSARALAEAILGATGIRPILVDHFGDHDAKAVCEHYVPWDTPPLAGCEVKPTVDEPTPSSRYGELLKCVETITNANRSVIVLSGGGTENHPALLRCMAQNYRLLGASADQIQILREPRFWREVAANSGIGFPQTFLDADSENADSENADSQDVAKTPPYLAKPFAGAGGLNIRRASEADSGFYLQQFIPGRSLGISFVLSPSGATLIGVTESLDCDAWYGPREFIYRGSWGPVTLRPNQIKKLKCAARYIQCETGLRGWLQFDVIEDGNGKLWLLELNPRWTAGMEVLVKTGANPVAMHLSACSCDWAEGGEELNSSKASSKSCAEECAEYFAKAVYYTPADIELTPKRLSSLHSLPSGSFADIPSAQMLGSVIEAGHPALTLRAKIPHGEYEHFGTPGSSPATVRSKLLTQLAALHTRVSGLLG